ncbi:MAG: glycoside hydrolase family 88 protein, partial [Bacteroidetes bacterium]|nr:glycoside hydrolase family 88 protein [Bacteroidota bacterium]
SDWANPTTRRSAEIWGRGNGWVVLTLSEILNNLPRNHPEWPIMANMLRYDYTFAELQDANTGHWYQLTVRKGELVII